jgi:inner membrane transporter RhtA
MGRMKTAARPVADPVLADPAPASTPAPVRPERAVGAALVLCSVTSLQVGAALSSSLFPRIGPAGTTALRLVVAALLMLAVARPDVRRWSAYQWRSATLLGLALAGMNGLFYQALARVPLGVAVTVEFLGPLGLAVVLSRRPRDLLWVLAALAGVVVLGTRHAAHGQALDTTGLLLAAGAGVFWAFYILAGARVAGSGTGRGGLAVATGMAALISLPVGVAGAGTRLLQPHTLAVGALVGLLASAIPYSCEIAALGRLPKKTFSVLLALEPAAAALAGVLLLGQSLPPAGLVGVALVVGAGVGSTLTAG